MKRHIVYMVKLLMILSVLRINVNAQNSISYSVNSAVVTFKLADYSFVSSDADEILNTSRSSLIGIKMSDEKYGVIANDGYPALPQLPLFINIPSNAENVKITMRNTITEQQNIPSETYIEPFIDYSKDGMVLSNGFNESFYSTSQTYYPSAFYAAEEPFFLMDELALKLNVLPFRYMSTTGILTILKKAEFVITWTSAGNNVTKSPISKERENFFRDIFIEYNGRPTKSNIKGELLIISAPQYVEGLSLYKEFKENIGIKTQIVSTDVTGKTASQISNYIKARASQIDYVLLVGSINDIPYTNGDATGNNKDNPTTDFGYRCFQNQNAIYGDVFLGRWPVYDATDLANLINKTIFMESNLHTLSKEVFFLAGHESNKSMERSFKKGHDNVTKSFSDKGFVNQKYYQSTCETVRSLSNSYPAWFIYSGHGSYDKMAYSSDCDIIRSSFNRKHIYPFVFSFACLSGLYVSSDNMSMCVTRTFGPISYFGSSVITYCNSDVAIETNIFKNCLGENSLGAMITKGMTFYAARFWSVLNQTRTKRYLKSYNLIGDPSIQKDGCGPVATYYIHNPIFVVRNIDLKLHSTEAIELQNSLTMETRSKLELDSDNRLLLNGKISTNSGVLVGNAKQIEIEGNTHISSGSTINLTADEFDFKPGLVIESGSDITFNVR